MTLNEPRRIAANQRKADSVSASYPFFSLPRISRKKGGKPLGYYMFSRLMPLVGYARVGCRCRKFYTALRIVRGRLSEIVRTYCSTRWPLGRVDVEGAV